MIQTFIANSASYLPLMENISYLIDLMEHCYNIGGLVEFLVQVRNMGQDNLRHLICLGFRFWCTFGMFPNS